MTDENWTDTYGGSGLMKVPLGDTDNAVWFTSRDTEVTVTCRTCGRSVTVTAGDVFPYGDPRLCEHFGGQPEPPQWFVVDGWKRGCPVTCSRCGDTTAFVVYSDRQRDDAWCEAALAETMAANGWRYGGYDDGNDICERCQP